VNILDINMNKYTITEIFDNINKLSSVKYDIDNIYERRVVFYFNKIRLIDSAIMISSDFIVKINEGECIDYIDDKIMPLV